MIRVLLALVAVLVVVLAVVLDQPWLYGAAAAVLVGVLGYLAHHFWQAYQRRIGEGASAAARRDDDDSLESYGIMDVRPQQAEEGADGTAEPAASSDEAAPETGTSAPETGTSAASDGTADGGPADEPDAPQEPEAAADGAPPEDWPENALSEDEMQTMSGRPSTPVYSDERPVLGPLLESLRASIGAQSVCLLIQEEVALEYRIEALASVQPDVQHEGGFETREPLLTATMSHQPVTVRSLDMGGRRELGYYGTVPAITQVALAPVERTDTSATIFLLADATAEVDLGSAEARSLLEHFAETVGILLDAEEARQDRGIAIAPPADLPPPEEDEPAPDETDSVSTDGQPRPRRDIIAEEMQAADAASDPLALVLVHLNRAESIARRGEEAVATAERHLRSRLEHLAPGQRVERFGELTYGIFVRHSVNEVEGWAADLQDGMARETGELEGGVSVGVAIRDAHHDPETLRADATDALLEAYETGTCTIIG